MLVWWGGFDYFYLDVIYIFQVGFILGVSDIVFFKNMGKVLVYLEIGFSLVLFQV